MSKLFNKLVGGFIILAVVVTAITSFRANLLSGGAEYDAFVAVFDCFPFANEMAAMAANIGQFGTTLQGLAPANVMNDITKIFGMAIVCPIVIGLASVLFLRVPDYDDWYDREQYMNTLGYRLKACVLNVLLMPLCAYLTAWGLDVFQVWLQGEVPFLSSGFISFLVLVIVFFVSVMVGGVSNPISMGMIFKHRLVSDLLGGVLKILGMNFLCFVIVLAILNDRGNAALGCLVTLFIYLAGIELMIGAIMGKIGES